MADKSEVQGPSARSEPDRARAGGYREEGFFQPAAGVRLYHCEWWPESSAVQGGSGPVVVLMHGFAEHCRRYDELAEHFLERGIAVCRLDARGHGRSNGQRGYVRRYEDYVDDLCVYVERVALRVPGRPLALLGHSNGGLIAIRAAQRGLAALSGLVLSNPLIELCAARRPAPDSVARWLSWAVGRLPLPNGVRPADLTHDARLQEAVRRDRWCHYVATPRWYWSARLAGRAALAEASRLTLSALVIVGEQDPLVDARSVRAFHDQLGARDKQLLTRPGELHEVLNELDRRSLFEHIADWLQRLAAEPLRSPSRPPAPRP
jgi:acylglycerol lipase